MRGRKKKRKGKEGIKVETGSKAERGEELTVKAKASSPELSVGSPVSGYHAV